MFTKGVYERQCLKPSLNIKRRRLWTISPLLMREFASEFKTKQNLTRDPMVRFGTVLLKEAGLGISKTLSEILVCPLSKQPLRLCEKTNSLISDSIGVSYPIVDGIPQLVPADGKIIGLEEGSSASSDAVKIDHQKGSSS